MDDRWRVVSSWAPGGAKLSACTLQMLESSKVKEKGGANGNQEGAAKVCLLGWSGGSWCAFSYANTVVRLDAVAMLQMPASR